MPNGLGLLPLLFFCFLRGDHGVKVFRGRLYLGFPLYIDGTNDCLFGDHMFCPSTD